MPTPKEAARQSTGHLPAHASWDVIIYELYVKQKIEESMLDAEAGRVFSYEDVKRELLRN